jgi:hypothetical protein
LFTSSSNNFVAAFSFSSAERLPFTSQECIPPAKTRIWISRGAASAFFFLARRKGSVVHRPVLGLVPPPPNLGNTESP